MPLAARRKNQHQLLLPHQWKRPLLPLSQLQLLLLKLLLPQRKLPPQLLLQPMLLLTLPRLLPMQPLLLQQQPLLLLQPSKLLRVLCVLRRELAAIKKPTVLQSVFLWLRHGTQGAMARAVLT